MNYFAAVRCTFPNGASVPKVNDPHKDIPMILIWMNKDQPLIHTDHQSDDNTLGFTCCSEILYLLKENYSILD